MLDLTKYPKFQRDTEGDNITLDVMVVIGWKSDNLDYYDNAAPGIGIGSPKHDAIFLSSAQQSWGAWSKNEAYWGLKMQELHASTSGDVIPLSNYHTNTASSWDNIKIPMYWYDFGLKIPYFEEKVDIFNRKSVVNDLTLSLDNYESKNISGGLNAWGENLNVVDLTTGESKKFPFGKMGGSFRLTDLIKIRPILNEDVAIFLKSPSSTEFSDLVPIYRGSVSEYKHNDKSARIVLEDFSDIIFNQDFPKENLKEGGSTPDRYKGRPIPIQIGIVDRAPGIFTRVPSVDGTSFEGSETGSQDIIHFDTEPISKLISQNISVGDGDAIKQSPLFIYNEKYWNLSQESADLNGEPIPSEEGGFPNFTESSGSNKIYMIGSAFDDITFPNPDDPNQMVTLQEWYDNYLGTDDAIDGMAYLYYGADLDVDLDNSTSNGYDVAGDDETDESPSNLFRLRNDTIANKFRIHSFSKPNKVKVRIASRKSTPLSFSEIKSYSSQDAHTNNNPDDVLDMEKCYNWSGNSPDLTSFVEVTGSLVGRYRYKSWSRTYYYPTFAVDFGASGSLPFNKFEILSDTAYYMKSTFQSTHPNTFGIYAGYSCTFIDQGSGWVTPSGPALRYPSNQSGADIKEIPQPGGANNITGKRQWWHWNIDTISTGEDSDIITDLGLTLQQDNLFENTSQLAQQEDEVQVGPNESCFRRYFPSTILGQTTQTAGDENNIINFSKGSSSGFTMRLYNISAFSTILVDRDSKYDFYADLIGRKTYGNSGVGFESVARKPADVIYTLLSSLGTTRGTSEERIESNALHEDWNLDFSMIEKDEMKNHIQGIAQSSMMVPGFNTLGELKFNDIKMNYTYDECIPVKSSDVVSFDIGRTPIREVFNEVTINYHYDYAEGVFEKQLIRSYLDLDNPLEAYFENNEGEILKSIYSPAYFSVNDDELDMPGKIIDSPYIRSDSLREQRLSSDYYPAGTFGGIDVAPNRLTQFLIAFHANQHTMLKISLPLKYFYLEVGDVIRLDKLLGDSNILAFGEDYTKLNIRNGQFVYPAFYITKLKRRIDKGIDLECMQMHFLNKNDSQAHGWLEAEEEELEVYGCLDEAAVNYNENTTIEVPCLYVGDIDSSNTIDWIDVALLQMAISNNDIILTQTNTPAFAQLDIDGDGVVGLHDIYTLVVNIMSDENAYGCMDGGYTFGAAWGPSNLPEADNYDSSATIHVQGSCEYTTYACGPENYSLNWCISELDIYNEDFVCYNPPNANGNETDSYSELSDGTSFENSGSMIAERVEYLFDSPDWNNSVNICNNESETIVHNNGLGFLHTTSGSMLSHQPTLGHAWINPGSQPHNPNAGIYIKGGAMHSTFEVSSNHLARSMETPFNEVSNHSYEQIPVVFIKIRMKANHRYMWINRGKPNSVENEDMPGYGMSYYCGSFHQNSNNITENSIEGQMNSNANPTFINSPFMDLRMGREDAFGNDSFSENLITPRIFTATNNPDIIPCAWDMPGPGLYPGFGDESKVIWPTPMYWDSPSHAEYSVSPHKDIFQLLVEQEMKMGPALTGGGGFTNSKQLRLNYSWRDYYESASYEGQNDVGENGLLPDGYEYETAFCCLLYDIGALNGFAEGDHEELFEFFGGTGPDLIDITQWKEDGGQDIEEEIKGDLGAFCTDSILGPNPTLNRSNDNKEKDSY